MDYIRYLICAYNTKSKVNAGASKNGFKRRI